MNDITCLPCTLYTCIRITFIYVSEYLHASLHYLIIFAYLATPIFELGHQLAYHP